jgi:soluble lytic murein transglycosylase-like protein
MIRLILLARLVSAPLPRVELVMEAAERAGVDPSLAVALVAVESRFRVDACRREWDGTTSYGLFQINDGWHPQYRGDLIAHCNYGARYLAECLARDKGSRPAGLSRYNSGRPASVAGRSYASRVLALYRLVVAQRGWETAAYFAVPEFRRGRTA